MEQESKPLKEIFYEMAPGDSRSFPIERRHVVRTILSNVQLDSDGEYSYTTKIDRQTRTVTVTRMK